MMKTYITALILLLLTACGGKQSYESLSEKYTDLGYETAAEELYEEGNKGAEDKIERKLIKTGDIAFETKDLKETRNQILEAVTNNKGYISSDNEYRGSSRISNNITIRIPSANFDRLLADISSGVENFDRKDISVSDVTEEFLDIQTRLKTKKELEQRYLTLLNQAKTVTEILEIEREIGTLRSDIESIEGRLKYLRDRVDYSTLSVNFYVVHYSEKSFGSRIKKGLVSGWNNLVSFVVFLAYNWSTLIIIILVAWFMKKLWIRFKRVK